MPFHASSNSVFADSTFFMSGGTVCNTPSDTFLFSMSSHYGIMKMMSLYLEDPYYFASAIAALVIASQVAAIVAIVLLATSKVRNSKFLSILASHSTLLAFIVAVTATASSLTFSDVFDMNPCKLCIYQRIVIFPQVIILGVALWKKHHDMITDYAIALASVAIPISIFHYTLQITDAPAVHAFAPCDVTGQAPSCSNYYIHMYGYVTIPMMALTASILIVILMILRKKLNT